METQTAIPSYTEGLKELRKNVIQMLPPEALEKFDNDADELQDTHQSILKLNEGDQASDFTLQNAIGKNINLGELLKQGQVVLTFYRGTWCPYCNLQLSLYQGILDQIKAAGANLVAISPQTPDASLDMQQKNELKFEVLSDLGNKVAQQFTTVFRNGDIPVNTMTELGFDFDSFYSDDSREIPVPAVFVIDQNRKVTFAKAIGGDYRNRVEPQDILDAL